MPQDMNPVDKALADAKGALAHADAKFPTSKPAPAVSAPAKPSAPKLSGLGAELKAKGEMVGKARQGLDMPKMHKGGPVLKDGPHDLKMGEHVLTADETETVKKHALMASGLKSLAKAAKKSKVN